MSLVYPLINGTGDFTITPTLVNQLISFFFCIFIVSVFGLNSPDSMIRFIIGVFVLQSLVQLFAFMSPSFLSFVQLFQSESAIEIGNTYGGGGMRALAISGSQFFGLSAAFAIVFILFFSHISSKPKAEVLDSICFVLLICGTIFSGRTGFIGLAAGLCYSIFVSNNKMVLFNFLMKSFVVGSIISITAYIFVLDKESVSYLSNKVLPFAFEFIYSFIDDGTLSTISSSRLSSQYFDLGGYIYFFGSGINEIYYSDAGYMRNLIFGGFSWLILLSLYQIFLLFFIGIYDSRRKLLYVTLAMFMFVLHYKGEALGFLLIIHKFLFLILMSAILSRKTDKESL